MTEEPGRLSAPLRASSAAQSVWGIYRELAHSPGRETDDAEILRAVAGELATRGFEVELKSPDELPQSPDAAVPPHLFVMCERIRAVQLLAAWELRGARIVNRPSGIRNTDREQTVALFQRHGVPFPKSLLVPTAPGGAPAFPGPCWVKRGDVHATQPDDVRYVGTPDELGNALSHLASREVGKAVIQDHVEGDLIKFYGVAGLGEESNGPSWFQWFYHRDQELSNYSFDPEKLKAATSLAANALGLEVYGGDAIVTRSGKIFVIDVNAWPSFALYRGEAASHIAALLAARFASAGVTR